MTCKAVASKIYVNFDKQNVYFENFGGTLNEEFGDCGSGAAEVRIVYLETFKVAFT
jgi:hypothetical protein